MAQVSGFNGKKQSDFKNTKPAYLFHLESSICPQQPCDVPAVVRRIEPDRPQENPAYITIKCFLIELCFDLWC